MDIKYFLLILEILSHLFTLELIQFTKGRDGGSVSSPLPPTHNLKEIRDERHDELRFIRDEYKRKEDLKEVVFNFD